MQLVKFLFISKTADPERLLVGELIQKILSGPVIKRLAKVL